MINFTGNYATAERYFLIGERELSYEFAVKALKQIEENSQWYRTNDLIEILQKEVSKDDDWKYNIKMSKKFIQFVDGPNLNMLVKRARNLRIYDFG